MSGNPCRVCVELRRERGANDVVKPGTVVVMLNLANHEGRGSCGMPMGEYDSAERAGTVATFLLDAVNRAYIAGLEDAHDRALAALNSFGKKE